MKKKNILLLAGMAMSAAAMADSIMVQNFRYAGPFPMQQPVQLDSTDVNAAKYDTKTLLNSNLNLETVRSGESWQGEQLPGDGEHPALHLLAFQVNTAHYFKGSLHLSQAPKEYKLYQDGKESGTGSVTLLPGSHTFVLKYLSQPEQTDSLAVCFESDSTAQVAASQLQIGDLSEAERLVSIDVILQAKRYSQLELSADGRWFITCASQTREDWSDHDFYLWDRQTGRKVKLTQNSHWLPTTSKFYQIRHVGDKSQMVVIDPATLSEDIWVENLPQDYFTVFPTEDKLLMYVTQYGPSEHNSDAFQFLHPDDRQPAWRDRSYLTVYDIKSGLQQQISFGYNNQWCSDISPDGKRLLLGKSESNLTSRPTTVSSVYELNLETMQLDTLVSRDGFVGHCCYSPDGRQVAIAGSPEALGGIGNVVPEGMTPSMIDNQLFLMQLDSHQITPVTKQFDPMVKAFVWSQSDNRIYFTAENRDSISLFRLNPVDGKIDMLAQPEEFVGAFSVAEHAPVLLFSGESNDHSWRLYTMEVGKKSKPAKCMEVLNDALYAGTQPAAAQSWTCRNSNGDDVCCRYYLPNGFDASQSYPMIVYYYGGCSPTSRNFESHYPWNIWAAQGYVVLVVNPSGATGFGQEWAARHVNTAGVDPARDIIESTQAFCDQHPFVNRERLGCIGASYGGFMTQYLQTVTDIFRCAVSHAGISDHTTYWGYGYWGYNYSEISMAGSYPWTRKDLFVERSPLYNADKIKSSMLFVHGTDDTNVPYNNSVQMFTALKLLGQDVAMVSIKGENHGIMRPSRRVLWHNAIMAWFSRCLKDDPTWWDTLYPKRTL